MAHLTSSSRNGPQLCLSTLGHHWLQARLLHVFIRSYFGRGSAQRKMSAGEKSASTKNRTWHSKLLQRAKNCLTTHAVRVGFLNIFPVPIPPRQDTTSTLPLSPLDPEKRPPIFQNG